MKAIVHQNKTSRAFTLIELLVVIAIIAILATLGISVGSSVMRNAKKLQAKTAMKGLEIGIGGYRTEYNRLPLSAGKSSDGSFDSTGSDGNTLIMTLMNANDSTAIENNPRRIPFYEPPSAKNNKNGYVESDGLYDPWGGSYIIWLDYDGDGIIANPSPGDNGATNLNGVAAIYTNGDPTQTAKAAVVRSWE